MKWYQKIIEKLKQHVKIAASDPNKFEVLWSFTSSRFRFISLFIVLYLITGILFTLVLVKGPLAEYFFPKNTTIERIKLEEQNEQIEQLSHKIELQENYISNLKNVLLGNIQVDTLEKDIPSIQKVNPAELNAHTTKNEKELAEKIKEDIRTGNSSNPDQGKKQFTYFIPPLKGSIIADYNSVKNPGIDIKTNPKSVFQAIQSGTVVYAGYSRQDGYILVLDHANGYISVYKHASTLFKKTGSKVQTGDPIGIVGDLSEQLTSPYLHFELWFDQAAVNPSDYISFL
jgi:septal ring factor EnvC (AmiA/AmiB activator)